ncbi:predicted protein [Histoplasma capsulatum G186AR]|uniref:Myb-like domain-containing protein n=1 Tax=Ajellomyces capsulatus (strain G186AR / H82 / ATCC MYA-2454 / RMSCC 2432) TaxID=447093 RepID=C0NVS0_AJECG|nr:uncharacterized protein HCBG_07250 [Histoplasma capsulatum G186AR]EEH04609.1 predicted protein [Histoplasma capsulatum G186AR]
MAGSKVCYTITFCHEETRRLLPVNVNSLLNPGRQVRLSVATGIHVPFTLENDALLKELKKGGEPWGEIAKHFPGRSKATVQVLYSTKLKHRTPPPTRKSKLKSRPRKHGCRWARIFQPLLQGDCRSYARTLFLQKSPFTMDEVATSVSHASVSPRMPIIPAQRSIIISYFAVAVCEIKIRRGRQNDVF